MSKSKHTPGPWELITKLSGSENHKGFSIWAPDGRDHKTWIADVSPVIDDERGDASEDGKLNARLIAAAPELLEACKTLLVCIGSFAHTGTYPTPYEPEIIGARNAIKKATSVPDGNENHPALTDANK